LLEPLALLAARLLARMEQLRVLRPGPHSGVQLAARAQPLLILREGHSRRRLTRSFRKIGQQHQRRDRLTVRPAERTGNRSTLTAVAADRLRTQASVALVVMAGTERAAVVVVVGRQAAGVVTAAVAWS
jgi:hypothetical protein